MNETPPAVRIVPATPDCAVDLLVLQKLCFREEAELSGEFDIPPLTQTLDSLLEDFRTYTVLIAWDANRLVGSVRARREGAVCHVGRLVVHPGHRRKGLGTALLAAIEAAHPAAAEFELFTDERSARNLRLYARLGYTPFRRQKVTPRLTLVFLRKRRL
jgi:GNAT superfamily N-acetyltransferase